MNKLFGRLKQEHVGRSFLGGRCGAGHG